ncbi:hypothetical protein HS088_TW11G00201 [Tripterygium wilfordii]|uniref:HVA22-like protein a n=2 Tax=Tripterygium wilfordii TaxID=458696 RepID=A0A7J7D192_TRIWF|nr:hypothetical protein HS088_TW11G00201 [Tripterygium wilfordii]
MSWGSLFKLLDFLSWPSFTLLFPLYASFWAVESSSYSRTQQCLSFWVLFALIRIVESTISKILDWLPFWPYAKGMVCVILVIPYFDGASYIYQYLFQTWFSENSRIWNILCMSRESFIEQSSVIDIPHTEIDDEPFRCQETCEPCHDNNDNSRPTGPRKFQKEWSCSLCMVSTSSEKCLKKHLQGKKHKAKEEEIILHELETRAIDKSSSSSRLKRTSSIILLGSLNQIAKVNFGRWGKFLNPAARSIILCKWRKPVFGWTKLNTDGSIDGEHIGFGGLLRDHKGDPVCAFVSKAYQDDIFFVELWAIWRGLVLALSLGIKVIWVESDSMSVVKTINREQGYGAKAHNCLKNIWALLKKFDESRVSHTWRETNRAADYLSKMVLRGSDVVLWPVDFPLGLQNIIMDDAQGRIYRRR